MTDRDDTGQPDILRRNLFGGIALAMLMPQPLGADHAILAYRADFRRTGRTDDEAMYVSSVWQRAPSGWVNVFSQDTPADGRSLP